MVHFSTKNDQVYALFETKKRNIVPNCLLRFRSTFSMSLMVLFAVLKMAFTGLRGFQHEGATDMSCFHYCSTLKTSLSR